MLNIRYFPLNRLLNRINLTKYNNVHAEFIFKENYLKAILLAKCDAHHVNFLQN